MEMERQDSFDLFLEGLNFEGLDDISSHITVGISNQSDAFNHILSLGYPLDHIATRCITSAFIKNEWLTVDQVREILIICDLHPEVASYICHGAPNVAAKGTGIAAFKDAAGKQQMLRNIATRGCMDMAFLWRLVALDGDRRCAMCHQPSHTIPKNGLYCTKCTNRAAPGM